MLISAMDKTNDNNNTNSTNSTESGSLSHQEQESREFQFEDYDGNDNLLLEREGNYYRPSTMAHKYSCGTDTIMEIDMTEIKFQKAIGKGSFGVVHKAIWAGKIVAVKKVETDTEVTAFQNEIKQLSRVRHENIIQMYGIGTSLHAKCIIMEFANDGSLYQFLHHPPHSKYNLSNALSWLLQCAKAIAYLHSIEPRPIIHRDLKPLNLLLTHGRRVLKVCDFGTACDLRSIMTDNRGSTAWMAPEVIKGKNYNEKCDVYSWGMILWELLTRRIPFEELGQTLRILWQVVNKVRPPLIQGCPKPIERLMKRCWQDEQSERPSMQEVVDVVYPLYRIMSGGDGDHFVSCYSSSENSTESCASPLNGESTADHTSCDVSQITSSNNTMDYPPEGSKAPGHGQTITPSVHHPSSSSYQHPNQNVPLHHGQRSGTITPENWVLPHQPGTISPDASANVVLGVENLFPPRGSAKSDDVLTSPSPSMPGLPTSCPQREGVVTAPMGPIPPLSISIPNGGLHGPHPPTGSFSSPWTFPVVTPSYPDAHPNGRGPLSSGAYPPHQALHGYPAPQVAPAPPPQIQTPPLTSVATTLTFAPPLVPALGLVAMRPRPLGQDPSVVMRRRSAEVPHRPPHGHRRSSSYESSELIGFEPLADELLRETRGAGVIPRASVEPPHRKKDKFSPHDFGHRDLSGLPTRGVKPFPFVPNPEISAIPYANTKLNKPYPSNRILNIANQKPSPPIVRTSFGQDSSSACDSSSSNPRKQESVREASPQQFLVEDVVVPPVSRTGQRRMEEKGGGVSFLPLKAIDGQVSSSSAESTIGGREREKLLQQFSDSDRSLLPQFGTPTSNHFIKNDRPRGLTVPASGDVHTGRRLVSPPPPEAVICQDWQQVDDDHSGNQECFRHDHRFQGHKMKEKSTILTPIDEDCEIIPETSTSSSLYSSSEKFVLKDYHSAAVSEDRKHKFKGPPYGSSITTGSKQYSLSPLIANIFKDDVLPASLLKVLQQIGESVPGDENSKEREDRFREELSTLLEVLTLPSRQKELLLDSNKEAIPLKNEAGGDKSIEQAESVAVEHVFPTNLTVTGEDKLIPSSPDIVHSAKNSDFKIVDKDKIILNALPRREIFRSSSVSDVEPGGGEKLRFFLVDDEKFFPRPPPPADVAADLSKDERQRRSTSEKKKSIGIIDKGWYNIRDLRQLEDNKANAKVYEFDRDGKCFSDRRSMGDNTTKISPVLAHSKNQQLSKKCCQKSHSHANKVLDKNRGGKKSSLVTENDFNSETGWGKTESLSNNCFSISLNEEPTSENSSSKNYIDETLHPPKQLITEPDQPDMDDTGDQPEREDHKPVSELDTKRKRLVRSARTEQPPPSFPTIESKTQFFEKLNTSSTLAEKCTLSKLGKSKEEQKPSPSVCPFPGTKTKAELPNYSQPKFFEDVTKIGSRDVTKGVVKCFPKEVKMFYPQSFIKSGSSKDGREESLMSDASQLSTVTKNKKPTKDTTVDKIHKNKVCGIYKDSDDGTTQISTKLEARSKIVKGTSKHLTRSTVSATATTCREEGHENETTTKDFTKEETLISAGNIDLITTKSEVINTSQAKKTVHVLGSLQQTDLPGGLTEEEEGKKSLDCPPASEGHVRVMRSISTQSDDSFVGDTSETLSVGEDSDFSDVGSKKLCSYASAKSPSKGSGAVFTDVTPSSHTGARFHRKRYSSSTQAISKKMESRGTQTSYSIEAENGDEVSSAGARSRHESTPHQIVLTGGVDYCRNCGASYCLPFDEPNIMNAAYCSSCLGSHGSYHAGALSPYVSPVFLTQSRCTTPTLDTVPENLRHPAYLSQIQPPQGSPIRLPLGMSLCPLGSPFTSVVSPPPLRSPVPFHPPRSVHSQLGEYQMA